MKHYIIYSNAYKEGEHAAGAEDGLRRKIPRRNDYRASREAAGHFREDGESRVTRARARHGDARCHGCRDLVRPPEAARDEGRVRRARRVARAGGQARPRRAAFGALGEAVCAAHAGARKGGCTRADSRRRTHDGAEQVTSAAASALEKWRADVGLTPKTI